MTNQHRLDLEKKFLEDYLQKEKEKTKTIVAEEGLQDVKPDTVISKAITFSVGFSICAAIALSLTALIWWTGAIPYLWMNMIVFAAFMTASIFAIFLPGLVKIDINHHGLMYFLDGRVKLFGSYIVLSEGVHWIPPVFMKVSSENMQREVLDFPKTAEDLGIEIPTLALKKLDESTADDPTSFAQRVVLRARVSIEFKRSNSFLSKNITINELEDGIRTTLISTCRYIGTQISYLGFMTHQGVIAEIIEVVVDRSAQYYWGRDTQKVNFPKIGFKDKKVEDAIEQATVESLQKSAEKLEGDHVRQEILEYAKVFSGSDTPGLRERELASQMVLAERNKTNHVTISGDGNPLEKLGALIGGLGAKPKTETESPESGTTT